MITNITIEDSTTGITTTIAVATVINVGIDTASGGGSNLSLGTRTTTAVPIANDNGTGVTLPAASQSLAGVLVAADKTKLDGLAQSDWNATTGGAVILNKPTTFPPTGSAGGDLSGNYPNPMVNALQGVALQSSAPTAGNVWQYSGTQWAHVFLSSSDVGLGNVDNTSDANKPISTATQAALDGKQDAITAGTTGQYYRGDKTFQTLDKTAVGLANVNNTSDANKPISTATQTALDGKQAAGTYVTSVTGTSPLISSGGTTPAISMAAASASANGYLSSTDWTTFNGKGAGIVTALSVTSANGFAGSSSGGATPGLTLSTSITGLLFGDGTALAAATINAPLSYSAGTLSIPSATTSVNGYLNSTDWNNFNGKQTALSGTGFVKISGTTISYDNSTYLTANQSITFSGDVTGSGTTSVTLTIANSAVTLAKMATIATATFLGRTTAGTGNVEALTATQATALLNVATTSANGLAPLTTTATGVKFLRDDMTYKASAQSWEAFQEKAVWFQDLFSGSVLGGWTATGNSGSTDTDPSSSDNSAIIGTRLGVALISSAAGTNTGYSWNTSSDARQLCSTPVKLRAAVAINSASASVLKARLGLGVSFNTTDATNQVACEINGTTFTGRTKTGGSSTTTTGSYTMTAGTWYDIEMVIPTAGTSIIFTIYNGATGASLFTETLTTNIPGAGIYLYPAFSASSGSGSGVTKLLTIDNLYYERNTLGRA